MRCAWKHLDTGEPADFAGQYYGFTAPPFNPFGRRTIVRQSIPIYVAALRPTVLKLAGEVADGVIGYMMTPKFLTDQVIPNLEIGARRAGRDPSTIDIASETICSISTDRAEAYRRSRIQVGIYMSYPVSAPLVNIMGLQSERMAVLEALMTRGPGCLQDVVDDKLVDAFSITGTPDEARRKLADFDGKLPHVLLHTPYVPPLAQDESADAFANIVETFGR
jgi:alkanesulfonate monooxygenase SsuD/methylene tetrahydromethanopterin reductase-like flavin-dependent oxidoreductase (luciferase family)